MERRQRLEEFHRALTMHRINFILYAFSKLEEGVERPRYEYEPLTGDPRLKGQTVHRPHSNDWRFWTDPSALTDRALTIEALKEIDQALDLLFRGSPKFPGIRTLPDYLSAWADPLRFIAEVTRLALHRLDPSHI